MKARYWQEKFMKVIFYIAAMTSVIAVALICVFLFANGISAISKIGFVKFISGRIWSPNQGIFGIFPMIVASL